VNQSIVNAKSIADSKKATLRRATLKRMLGWMFVATTGGLLVLMLASGDGDVATRYTVRLALFWYAAAYVALLARSDGRSHRGRREATASESCHLTRTSFRAILLSFAIECRTLRMIRWYWTLGLICYLVHVAVAFHYFHQWSHGVAVEYTQRTSGFGSGIYASYLFSLVWLADVLMAWMSPQKYANRNRFQTYSIHLFLLFMVFNGAIVFASGPTRWISLAVFCGILAYSLIRNHQLRFAKDAR
jgi:hypothetical protein